MDFLNRTAVILIIILFAGNYIKAQEQQKLTEAFSKSYAFEKKQDYKMACGALLEYYDENSYEINLRLGWLFYQSGQMENSLKYYNRAAQLMPMSEEAKFGLIYPLSMLNRWDDVAAQYLKILANNPQNTRANYNLGLISYNKTDYDAAYRYFEKVVNLYPFDYDGLLMFAWTNLKMGKNKEAKVLFQKVLLYSPGDTAAQRILKSIH